MLRERLSSNTGATLILALVFFLLCAVAGSVILVAGSGAAGRLSDVKTDQQAYYSATSAAKVLKVELEKGSYNMDTREAIDGSEVSALDGLISAGLTATSSGDTDHRVKGCSIESDTDNKLNVVFDFVMNSNQNITVYVRKLDSNNSDAVSNIEYQCMVTTVAHTSGGDQNLINWTADIVPYVSSEQ